MENRLTRKLLVLILFLGNWLNGTSQETQNTSTAAKNISAHVIPRIRQLNIAEGLTIEYAEQGSGSKPSIIFLHGFPDSWRSFENVMKLVPEDFHVIAVSQRGFGNSSKPAEGFRPEDFASDLSLFMEQKGISDAIIVGHSMGSVIAQQFALSYPEKTKAVVLTGTFYDFGSNGVAMELVKEINGFTTDPAKAYIEAFQQSTLANPVDPSFFSLLVEESLKVPLHVWKDVMNGLAGSNFTSKFHLVKSPVLVLWGKHDGFCPAKDQELLIAALPDAQLKVFNNLSHSLHWEDPQVFVNTLVSFIKEIK